MVGDWPTVPLGSLAAEDEGAIAIGPFGSAMKAEVYTSAGVPVIRGTNITSGRGLSGDWVFIPNEFADSMPRCVVSSGDLVFPHRGAIGQAAIVPKHPRRYFLSTSLMKITLDRTKADPRYVAYYFKSEAGRREISRFASQVGTPGIGQPLTSLRQFAIPAPPVHIQRTIADLLGALDDKIELNRHVAETLEAMARALFKSWFVDFDPVRAKGEGRPAGLPNFLTILFPAHLGENGIPEGWKKGSITDLATCAIRRHGGLAYDGASNSKGHRACTRFWSALSEWRYAYRAHNPLPGER
jgi:type I restriction enzyme S subunit